jgi:solute carrier family 24 (sodium/potassium/calcium exchanger), member 6
MNASAAGQGTMAIAACFGGPIFNLLVSFGGPVLYATVKHGDLLYRLTRGVIVLVSSTVAVLGFLLLAAPLKLKWTLPRLLGFGLLAAYLAMQLLFLAVEVKAMDQEE